MAQQRRSGKAGARKLKKVAKNVSKERKLTKAATTKKATKATIKGEGSTKKKANWGKKQIKATQKGRLVVLK